MKPQGLKKTWQVIESPEAAYALTDRKQRQYLLPFIGNTLSLTEVAKRLAVRPNTLLYHIRKFQALGLLKIAAVRRRRGRSSKLYTASAEQFLSPSHSPVPTRF